MGHRRVEEIGKGLENALGLVMGRRRSVSTSLTKRRMTSRAKADLEKAEQDLKITEKEIEALESDLQAELSQVDAKWTDAIGNFVEEPVAPYKKDIYIEMFGLLWIPYYAFEQKDGWTTVPAHKWDKA